MASPENALYRLSRPQQLLPGESLVSLISRNAQYYGFPNPMLVLARIIEPNTKLASLAIQDWTPEFHRELAALLCLDEKELSRLKYGCADKRTLRLLGVTLHRDFVASSRKRVCPLCLKEGGYHRSLWDLSILTVCPVHSVRLIARCPNTDCDRPLTWARGWVTHCANPNCHYDLRTAVADPVDNRFMGGVRSLVGYLDGSKSIDVGPPELDIEACLRLSLQLGAAAKGLERSSRPGGMVENHSDVLCETLDAGWRALTDWPRGFHALLDGLRANAVKRKGRYGLRKEFGYLSLWLSRLSDEPWRRPVADAFANYIAEQDDCASTAEGLSRFGSPKALRNRHITVSEAARFMKVSVQTMLILAEREDLFLVRPSGVGAPGLLRADRVHQLRELKNTTLLKGEAELRLGVARKIFRSLEIAGLLTGTVADTRVTKQRQYAGWELDDLVRRLEAKFVEPGKMVRPRQLVSITRLRNTAEICQAILDGRMDVAGVNARAVGLQRVLVTKVAVQAALPRRAATLSVVQVAAILEVAAETVRLWVQRGFLRASRFDGNTNERGLRLTQEDIAEFNRDYGTAAMIAAERGETSGRWLTHRLGFLGIKPVSGPSIDGGTGSLFRRADIPNSSLNGAKVAPKVLRTDASTKPAFDLAASIGLAVASALGHPLKRGWNDFSNDDFGVYLQVLTGKRLNLTGRHMFRFNDTKVGKLRRADSGLVAFAFPGHPVFLMVPWKEIVDLLDAGKADRLGIVIRLNESGTPDRFLQYCQTLPSR